MLHIIGLNHSAQSRTPGGVLSEDQETLCDCLCRVITEVRPTLLAEEDSAESLVTRSKVSIVQEVAERFGIEHRFCDPNMEQRREMGYVDDEFLKVDVFMREGLSDDERRLKGLAIAIAHYFPIRERFWLEQLSKRLGGDVVFVCGDFHVESFRKMLERRDLLSRIVERGIGVTAEQIRLYSDAIQYLRDHRRE